MTIYKKCKFGCVFGVDDKVWAETAFKAMKYPNQTFKCLKCHRDNLFSSYTNTTGGAATLIPTNFHRLNQIDVDGGKKTDVLVKQRMLGLLQGIGMLESSKKQKVDSIYQQLSMKLMNAELTSNFPTPRIFNILESGTMKNMWHFNPEKSKYTTERDDGERQFFGGISRAIQTVQTPQAEGRPIYLVLNVGNLTQGGAAGYGNSVIVYKDSVKLRSTYLATDSLQMIRGDKNVGTGDVATFGEINNVLLRVTDNKLRFLCSLAGGPPHKYVDEFIEAHGWGELSLAQDVKAILMSEPDLENFPKGKDSDHKDIFPPELHGKSLQERTNIIQKMKTDLKDICTRNGIELHYLKLDQTMKANVASRPMQKI